MISICHSLEFRLSLILAAISYELACPLNVQPPAPRRTSPYSRLSKAINPSWAFLRKFSGAPRANKLSSCAPSPANCASSSFISSFGTKPVKISTPSLSFLADQVKISTFGGVIFATFILPPSIPPSSMAETTL